MPGGFQVGPVQGDFIGAVLRRAAQLDFDGGLEQEARDEKRPLAAQPPLLAPRLFLKLPRVSVEKVVVSVAAGV